MKRKFLLIALTAVLAGALLNLPGAAVQLGAEAEGGAPQTQPQPLQPWMERTPQAEEDPLPGLFLKALAKQLGITEEQLKRALVAAKDEVIAEKLREAVQKGWLTREQAEWLRQRLSQASPRELARIMLRLREMKELKELKLKLKEHPFRPMAPRFEKMKRGFLLKPEFNKWRRQPGARMEAYPPPYPPLYGYNCVCYCNFPPPFWNWDWPQPYEQQQPHWRMPHPHRYYPQPQPEPEKE